MRILLIDVNCKNSSTGKIVYDLFCEAKKKGHDVAICYGRGDLVQENGIYKFGLDWETSLHAGLSRISGYNGYFSYFSTIRLISYIEKFKPDVIHIHELHAYFVNIAQLIKYIKKKNIKVVWTFHCEYMYTGKCGYAYDCMKFQQECSNCPQVGDYPRSIFFDRTKRMFNMKKNILENLDMVIVTPSKWLENRVRKSFLKNNSICTIHNGVDTKIFYRRNCDELRKELKIDADKKIVLFVAPNVMDERKGGMWVIKLSELMEKENLIFLMIGGGSSPVVHNSNIRFLGPVYNQEVLASYYSLADVFILCSERETYSMTCAEALCCGTPVIGFKCGAPETVFNAPNAVFVEYGNLLALKCELEKKLFSDQINIQNPKEYSLEIMSKEYISLYEKILNS